MSTKQVLLSPVDIEDADFESMQPIDPRLEQENEEFEKFKEEMHESDSQAKIFVSRKMTDTRGQPIGKKTYHCFECGIDDHTFSQLVARIRDDYGTGLYQIQGRDSNGKFKFSRTVGVQAPNNSDNENKGDNVAGLIEQFSNALERQQERQEQFMRNMMPRQQGNSIDDFVKILTAASPILTPVIVKLFEKPEQKSVMEQLTEFKMLQDTLGIGNNDNNGDDNLYTLLSTGVKEFAGPIAAALAAGAQSGELDENGMPIQKLPAPQPENATEANVDLSAIKKNIHVLIQNAKGGTNPNLFGDILVNQLPDDQVDAFWDFISAPDAIEKLITMNAEVRDYREWFETLQARVIHILSETDTEVELQPEIEGDRLPSESMGGEVTAVAGEDSTTDDNGNDSTVNPERPSGNTGDA